MIVLRVALLTAISLALVYAEGRLLSRVDDRLRSQHILFAYLAGMAVIGLTSIFLGMLFVGEPWGILIPAVLLAAGFLQWLIPHLMRGSGDHSIDS